MAEGYVRSEEDLFAAAKPSMTSRLLWTARRAASSAKTAAAEVLENRDLSYRDLGGDAPQTRLDKAEQHFAADQEPSRSYFFRRPQQVAEKQEQEVPAQPRVSDRYVAIGDGEEESVVTSALPVVRPGRKRTVARLDARPYVDVRAFAETSLKIALPAEPSGIIRARLEAEAKSKNPSATAGGLWSLKARLAVLEKEVESARKTCVAAESAAATRRDAVRKATDRRDDLRKKAARLRAILAAARDLQRSEGDDPTDVSQNDAVVGVEEDEERVVEEPNIVDEQEEEEEESGPPPTENNDSEDVSAAAPPPMIIVAEEEEAEVAVQVVVDAPPTTAPLKEDGSSSLASSIKAFV